MNITKEHYRDRDYMYGSLGWQPLPTSGVMEIVAACDAAGLLTIVLAHTVTGYIQHPALSYIQRSGQHTIGVQCLGNGSFLSDTQSFAAFC